MLGAMINDCIGPILLLLLLFYTLFHLNGIECCNLIYIKGNV